MKPRQTRKVILRPQVPLFVIGFVALTSWGKVSTSGKLTPPAQPRAKVYFRATVEGSQNSYQNVFEKDLLISRASWKPCLQAHSDPVFRLTILWRMKADGRVVEAYASTEQPRAAHELAECLIKILKSRDFPPPLTPLAGQLKIIGQRGDEPPPPGSWRHFTWEPEGDIPRIFQ